MTDVQRVSTFLQVDAQTIENQQWSQLLPSLIARAAEFETLKSQAVVLEVEVEQANRNAEARVATIQSQLDSTRSELQVARNKDDSVDAASRASRSEVVALEDQLRLSQDSVQTLKKEVASLSDEKRAALALVDRQSQAAGRYEEEYKSLSERYHSLRKDISSLESQVHEARTSASSAQFKQQSVEQELVITKKSVEWLTSELETKTSDFAKYRKESSTLITTIQQEADIAKSQVASLELTNDSFKKHNDEMTSNMEQNILKVQDLKEQLITKEESFRNEMATQTRLIELHERSAKDAKLRIAQLERNSERRLQNESQEAAKWMQLHHNAQERLEDIERHTGELEADLERVQNELSIANERLSTSSQSNGIALLSPSAHVISKVQSSGMSLTELYSEYLSTKQDLEHERRKNSKIQKSFDDLIHELETRAPQLQEQREEFLQLQLELASMSEAAQSLTEQKIATEKELQSKSTEARDQAREIHLYRQQIKDLSRQVQKLLFEIEEQGFRASPLTEAEVTALNRMLEEGSSSTSAVDNLISDRLVLFKNIQELQEKNEQQLKITRQLGARMERDEEDHRKKFADLESQTLSEANTVITNLNVEIQSMHIKMESYLRERDMFRRMLTQSVDTQSVPAATEQTDRPALESTEALRELQSQFDAYRNETMIDQKTLSEQLAKLSKERSELSLQVARVTSQLELAEERHRMLNGTLEMMRKEVEEARKRGTQTQEALAKQDIRAQQIAEELIDNKSQLQGLRAENANLKAEKQLWKSIEQRMTEEVDSLRVERNRMNNLIANLQALQSERERTETEMTQRYSHQLQSLQTELESTKQRLSDEREEVRRMTLNKDQNSRDSHEKVESLLRQVSDAREAHAIANTEKENLKSRVLDLETQLQAASEKLSIFASRPDMPGVGTEQQLQVELADLRSALEAARTDVTQANVRADKMKEISAASEQALQTMNQTHDQFVAATEEQISGKQSEISNLNRRVQDLLSELDSANQELGQIRFVENGKRQELQSEVESLSNQVEHLKEVEEKFNIANSFYQDDLRSQAEIAQEAQQNYENELVKHAEAAQSLRTLRQDYNELRNEVLNLRKEAESSDARLASEDKSWQSQRDLYERELSELRARLTELQRQNELLHTQFETYTAQLSHRTYESATSQSSEADPENVQEIIRYLRREKEIVDVSYEVLQQENKRTKQELLHATKNLDELSLALASERQSSAQMSVNAAQHGDLLAKMNELNLIRESNVVLRSENEGNVARIGSLENELRTITSQLEPLEAQLRSSEAESQAKSEEIALLLQDNERWKQRNQSILQKYERIDPAELQDLKDKSLSAEKHAQSLQESLATLQAQLTEKEKSATELQEHIDAQSVRYDALMKQSRDRIKKERTEAKAALASAQESTAQVETLTKELEDLRGELHSKATEASTAEQAELESLKTQVGTLQAELSEKDTAMQLQSSTAEKEIADIKAAIDTLTKEKTAALEASTTQATESTEDAGARLAELESELSNNKIELEKQKVNFSKLRAAAKKNKDELQTSLSSIADLQAQLEAAKSTQPDDVDEIAKQGITEDEVERRIAEALKAASVSEDEIEARIQEALANRSESTKDSDEAIQERIDEALTRQSEASEEAIQKRIDEAVAKVKDEVVPGNPEQEKSIEEIIKAKDEETKAKVRAITKERVDQIVEQRLPKKIEAERQTWLQDAEAEKVKAVSEKEAEMKKMLEALESDIKEKLKAHGDNVRKESTMRVTLQMKGKDREIAALQKKIAEMAAASTATATATANATADEAGNGDTDGGQVSGTEAPVAGTAAAARDPASNGKMRGRGGKYQRGVKRGGLLGTKRVREDNESDQPAKKAA